MVVFAEAVAVAVAALEPPARPTRERAVGLGEAGVAEVVRGHHPAQRPAVDGRLHEAAQDGAFAHEVRERAVVGLEVERRKEGVPREVGVAGREGDRVEAVVPAPDAVHPVLRHQERVAPEEARLRDGEAPEQVRRGGARFREFGRRGGKAREDGRVRDGPEHVRRHAQAAHDAGRPRLGRLPDDRRGL